MRAERGKMTEKEKEILNERIRKQAEEDRKRRLEIRNNCQLSETCYADCLKLCDKG